MLFVEFLVSEHNESMCDECVEETYSIVTVSYAKAWRPFNQVRIFKSKISIIMSFDNYIEYLKIIVKF